MKFIITSDNHLRPDAPICRTETQEEWMDFQYQRLVDIVNEAYKRDADIVIGGDLFDSPRQPTEVLNIFLKAMSGFGGKVYVIGGNHSLLHHREGNVNGSTVGVLKTLSDSGVGNVIYCTCNEELINGRFEHSHRLNDEVTIVHTLCMETEEDIPFNCEAVTPSYLFDKYDTPFIFTGDYHKAFCSVNKNRAVVNPGTMCVQTVREAEYTPSVYYVDTGVIDSIERISLFHDPSKVSDEHITRKREKQAEIESVLEAIKSGKMDVSLDYVKNLFYYVEHNKVKQDVIAILDEIKEGIE